MAYRRILLSIAIIAIIVASLIALITFLTYLHVRHVNKSGDNKPFCWPGSVNSSIVFTPATVGGVAVYYTNGTPIGPVGWGLFGGGYSRGFSFITHVNGLAINVTVKSMACFTPYNDTPPYNVFSNESFCIPVAISVNTTNPTIIRFINLQLDSTLSGNLTHLLSNVEMHLNYWIPCFNKLYANYVRGGKIKFYDYGVEEAWGVNGSSMVAENIYYTYDFEMVAPNGTRIGIIHAYVSLQKFPSNAMATMNVELVPKSEVRLLNSIRLGPIIGANYTLKSWAGYVVSYYSGGPEDNDTFEVASSAVTVPNLNSNPICGSAQQGLAGWVGLSPGNQWNVPYIQAGWEWAPQLGYLLVWTSKSGNYVPEPVSISPYAVAPSTSVEATIQYENTTGSQQYWYIIFSVDYLNETIVVKNVLVEIPAYAYNWQAAQFIAETPTSLISGFPACMPNANPNFIYFAINEVYDTVVPGIVFNPNGTAICLSIMIPQNTLPGIVYYYHINLSNSYYGQSAVNTTGYDNYPVPNGYLIGGFAPGMTPSCGSFYTYLYPPGSG